MVNDFRQDHNQPAQPGPCPVFGPPNVSLRYHRNRPEDRVAEQFRLWYGAEKAATPHSDESLWLIRNGRPRLRVGIVYSASEHNDLYECYVKKDVDRLLHQYDFKYWPALSEVIQALGTDAERAQVTANDPATAAATESRKSGRSDFVKALLARIDDNRVRAGGFISNGFSLSDSGLASLVNCGLDLAFDELVDADFIKRFRQRQRQVKKA
ncbi:hypothetical protein AN403_6164 [Pseudomonas fluorescens]|uniref:Uncharacterized protein n=2 Tax=Pseudomonas fluorescens TaxID=294 RepID=A0A0P8X7L2_PSEFL|nr:hypothetical protein AN403_6164 [Pseudomonas fluorescens]